MIQLRLKRLHYFTLGVWDGGPTLLTAGMWESWYHEHLRWMIGMGRIIHVYCVDLHGDMTRVVPS
jgi:hypothetical protein